MPVVSLFIFFVLNSLLFSCLDHKNLEPKVIFSFCACFDLDIWTSVETKKTPTIQVGKNQKQNIKIFTEQKVELICFKYAVNLLAFVSV